MVIVIYKDNQLVVIICDEYHYLTNCYENYCDFNINYTENRKEL